MNCITADHLRYRYRQKAKPALDDVSFSIEQGSVTALLGPNGAGKTTLLDLILGWKRSEEGSLLVKGKDPSLLPRKEAGRLMALAAQAEHITFSFSVLDYVLFGRAAHIPPLSAPGKEDYRIAEAALQQVGLLQLAERSVTSLSGGELQLVKLARSVAQQPRLLLLDEPTSDLDPANTSRVLEIMHSVADGGTTLVFTTHDPMLASDIATHTALLKNGRLLFFGPSEEGLTAEHLRTLYDIPMKVLYAENRRLIFRSQGTSTSTN